MSVQALSPFSGSKRLFDEQPEDTGSPCDRGQGKRGRFLAGSPGAGRCGAPLAAQVHPSALAALKGLFPGMDDQAVTAVLAECGNDIDAAIRRLNQLRIEADAAQQQQQQQQQQQDPQGQQQQQQQQGAVVQQHPHLPAQRQPPGDTAGPSAAPGGQQPQADQQQQQQQQHAPAGAGGASTSGAAAGPAAPAAPVGPQTAEQWVDALVGEMAQASDIPDARGRAAKLLHAFEQFVAARGGGSGGGGGPAGAAQLQARLEEAQRENSILKRAVQIQNARMQEAAAREHELGALKQVVAQYQERLRHLELSNYSLALHLQKATGDAPVAPGHRPPDVY